MKSKEGWQWFGMPGHFIGAKRCCFHLHTHVNGWCVSSVGCYCPGIAKDPMQIGYNRLYETFINKLNSDTDNADVIQYEVESWSANDHEQAEQNHLLACCKAETMTNDYKGQDYYG